MKLNEYIRLLSGSPLSPDDRLRVKGEGEASRKMLRIMAAGTKHFLQGAGKFLRRVFRF